jgi:hypothetical protein
MRHVHKPCLRGAHTVLCLGLNLVIPKIPRRYKMLILSLVILNELRGVYFVYELVKNGVFTYT